MDLVLAYCIRFFIDVICIGHCFRTKKKLSSLAALLILYKAVEDYDSMARCIEHYLHKTKLTKTTNKVVKSKKVKMGFDLSA